MRFRATSVIAAWLCLAATANAATVIHAGRLIDGRGGAPQSEVSIVIDDGRITKIAAGYIPVTNSDRLIRLTEHTVMPGLMDMHTHLMSQHSKDSYTERFFMDQADYAAARALLEQSLSIYRTLGEPWGIGLTVNYLGDVARCEGNYEQAAALYQSAVGAAPLERGSHQSTWAEASRLLDCLGASAEQKTLIRNVFAPA
jgi:tetratricopeptide (TPR) repeat protein